MIRATAGCLILLREPGHREFVFAKVRITYEKDDSAQKKTQMRMRQQQTSVKMILSDRILT